MKKKKQQPKYHRRVTSTRDPQVREKFYKQTDNEAPLGPLQIVAGSIQHPETGLYQVWLSTNGLDFNHLGAFVEQYKASGIIMMIQNEAKAGHFSNQEYVDTLFDFIADESDYPPEDLPEEIIRKLAADIAHIVAVQKEEKA